MERDLIRHGVRIDGRDFEPEIEYTKNLIKRHCIDRGMNLVDCTYVRDDIPAEYFIELAKFLTENKVYFTFHYQHTRRNKGGEGTDCTACGYDKETAVEMKKTAGEYFLGHSVGELGAEFCAYGSEYTKTWKVNQSENFGRDLKEAWENVAEKCRYEIGIASMDGEIPVTVCESTSIIDPIANCGQSFIMPEGFNGNPDIMAAMGRAATKRMPTDIWGSYMAHEWYAGVRWDGLKLKRFKVMYNYLYLSGANYFMIESGDDFIAAHGAPRIEKEVDGKVVSVPAWGWDSEICTAYRKYMDEFADFVNHDNRPKGGPKVKVAFVQGNYDGYSSWRGGSSIYNVFSNPDFSWSKPEFMWRIFDDIHQTREWYDVHNFGDVDLSNAPGYGTFDIVNANAGNEIFSQYDYLIFTGWNSMTDEIYEELKKFVHGGGRLFMTAVHLNTSVKRDGEIKLINNGDVSDLFGCRLSSEDAFESNAGFKHVESIVPELKYPRIFSYDPIFSEGYLKYAKAELTTGVSAAGLSSKFTEKDFIAENETGLIENKYGDGYAILMPCLDYPSASGWGEYKSIVREILTASHREASIKVFAPSKVRFSVYEGDKVYLLNTDFESKAIATIDYGTEKREIILEPMELRAVER